MFKNWQKEDIFDVSLVSKIIIKLQIEWWQNVEGNVENEQKHLLQTSFPEKKNIWDDEN